MEQELLDKVLGSTYGNAVGDALGAPLEFKSREMCYKAYDLGPDMDEGAGTTRTKLAGDYTDDTDMMMCIGRAIMIKGRFDPAEIAHQFHLWQKSHPPDIGCQTSMVLHQISDHYDSALDIASYGAADSNSGNGSIMRHGIVLPYTLYATELEALWISELQSSLTHASKQCVDACKFMTLVQRRLIRGLSGEEAISRAFGYAQQFYFHPKLLEAVHKVVSHYYKKETDLPTTGYVIDTLVRALWPVYLDMSFEDGLHSVVMQGGDADTAGAVAGCLLGTMHGVSGMPEKWINKVKKVENAHKDVTIETVTMRAIEAGEKAFPPWVYEKFSNSSTGKAT